jgi:hypothetical protein
MKKLLQKNCLHLFSEYFCWKLIVRLWDTGKNCDVTHVCIAQFIHCLTTVGCGGGGEGLKSYCGGLSWHCFYLQTPKYRRDHLKKQLHNIGPGLARSFASIIRKAIKGEHLHFTQISKSVNFSLQIWVWK